MPATDLRFVREQDGCHQSVENGQFTKEYSPVGYTLVTKGKPIADSSAHMIWAKPDDSFVSPYGQSVMA
jgi:hypothetical protein